MKTVVLVGPQNVGKTTLFNRLTQSHHKAVNYPGSTVDYYVGFLSLHSNCPARLIDTPGIHSLNPRTLDEDVTLRALKHLDLLIPHHTPYPDLIVAVLDCTQLPRQLPLIRQLARTKLPMIIALSKGDLIGSAFSNIFPNVLEQELGCRVVLYSGKETIGIQALRSEIEIVLSSQQPIEKPHFDGLAECLIDDYIWAKSISTRVVHLLPQERLDLDRVFLHPWLGPILFIGIMVLFFWSIFALASPMMESIDLGFAFLNSKLSILLPAGLFQEFITKGLVTGISAVFIFVPQIFILFFVLGLLEGSGYLARGAVLIDRPLSAIGLSGRSFVPLLSGCACAIPAMMAARTIPSKKERLTTLFIIPLMTCSARLPVYGLLITLLLGHQHAGLSGLVLTSIYLGSFVFASLTAVLVGKLLNLQQYSTSFQMELPRWHWPIFTVVLKHAYKQTISFIQKAGIPIAVISIALWILARFPSPDHSVIYIISTWISPLLHPMGLDGKMGVALLLSFAAREVFASSIALLYPSGPLLSTGSILGLIVFFMISMQCLTTVAVAKREMGNWKLPIIMMGSYVIIAYLLSCLTFWIWNFI